MRVTPGVVNYPKRRQKMEAIHIEGVPEPVRESIYDVMLKNFQLVGRVTFLHRIIYAGEHSLPREQETLHNIFSDIIDQVNEEDHLEKLTGFILTYNKCFIHILEGDEDSINKHLKLLLGNENHMQNFGTMKLLLCIHHINQRFHHSWTSYSGTPSKLFGDININSTLEETGRHIYNCVKKIYGLISVYHGGCAELDSPVEIKSASSLNDESSYELPPRRTGSAHTAMSYTSLRSASVIVTTLALDPFRNYLPEYELVRFLINSSYTQTIQSYYELYRLVPQRDIYKDRVWPIPSDFIPYDVFSKPYDTVVELPRDRTEDYHSRAYAPPTESTKEKN